MSYASYWCDFCFYDWFDIIKTTKKKPNPYIPPRKILSTKSNNKTNIKSITRMMQKKVK